MDGQISIFDYQIVDKGYETFHEVCRHRGWHKPATETEPSMYMCGCAGGKLARGWGDWIPCTESNCYLLKGGKK